MSVPYNRAEQMELATKAATAPLGDIVASLYAVSRRRSLGIAWRTDSKRLAQYLEGGFVGVPTYRIFSKGNSKLPFYAFSALPIVTCPGAGECAQFCYSLRAWRNSGGFLRQVQNTVLLRFAPQVVAMAFGTIPKDSIVRLYVDGDFGTAETLAFWFDLLHKRPDLPVYGYSKSWELLLAYTGKFPANYLFNASSGSKYGADMLAKVLALPITRGNFLALPISIPKMPNSVKYSHPTYKAAVRESAKAQGLDKIFLCPGKCGTCANGKHACGNDDFIGIDIVIGIH